MKAICGVPTDGFVFCVQGGPVPYSCISIILNGTLMMLW
jgi:hypothetical protein